MQEHEKAIYDFINDMGYLENEHVLGVYFYGSYLTGFHNRSSDVDLHIVFDNFDSEHLIRGVKYVAGFKIEYFEKPLEDLYLSVDNKYLSQNNAMLSIVGTSQIIFDKTGALKELQRYTIAKFSKPLIPLSEDEARECVSIIDNRMVKLRKAFDDDEPNFCHLYHLTIEKICKFYHRLNGLPKLQTSKVYKVYTDAEYRRSFYKDDIPEPEFIEMYLRAISDDFSDKAERLKIAEEFYAYAKRNVSLDDKEYRILIKSYNK